MEKLVSSRGSLRGWVTRESNNLSMYMHDKKVTIEGLKLKIAEFDKRLNSLDDVQLQIEQFIKDEKQLDVEIGVACDFRTAALANKMAAMTILAELKASAVSVSTAKSGCFSNERSARLPKLEINKFNGDLTKWQTFWDQFEAIVDKSDMAAVTKFSYLISLLEGEALEVVSGLPLTQANYEIARTSLKDRFGRKERTIFSHIQALLNTSVPKDLRVATLWKIRDDLNVHIRCLETLGVSGDKYGIFLTPLVLSKLPQEIRMEWAREGEGKERDLVWLLKFLKTEIERRERAEGFKAEQTQTASKDVRRTSYQEEEKPPHRVPTASVLYTHGNSNYMNCVFCDKRTHPSEKCWQVTKLSLADRHKFIKDARVCFRCLNSGHIAKGCTQKCTKCGGRHHALLCDPSRQKTAVYHDKVVQPVSGTGHTHSTSTIAVSHVEVSCSTEKLHTVLPTAQVLVRGHGKSGMKTATVMFDTGSDTTYITSSLVRKIKPEWVTSKYMSYAAFGGSKPSTCSVHSVYKVGLQNKGGGIESLQAVEVETICAPMVRPRISRQILQSIGDLELADHYEEKKEVNIDILIGLDHYWDFVNSEVIKLADVGLVVQSTCFGWVLSGSWRDPSENESSSHVCNVTHQLNVVSDISEYCLSRLWDLEIIGVSPEVECSSEDRVLREFNENIRFVDGRYEVQLPWKENVSKLNLLNNRKLAGGRAESLNRRLARDSELRHKYNEALFEMERDSIITEVDQAEPVTSNRPIFYLPHHPVVKESSLTTKVRPVFDASAKGFNQVSLNDCLESGPSLNPGLVDVLIRFRRWRVGLIADITKAFLQIRVREEDQDVHRFLWDVNGKMRVMKFLRVPFGNTCSPFLLNATIRHHISLYPRTRAIEELENNLYVDDWCTGTDYDDDTCGLFQEGQRVLAEGSFHLAKCGSNSEVVNEMLFKEFGAKHSEAESVKILGLKWLKREDCFAFDGVQVPTQLVTTKRVALSFLARVYDPLGFLNPYIMIVKLIVQDIWKLNLGWDDETPLEISQQFLKWVEGLTVIQNWKIPRCYCSFPWSESVGIELHCFGDASERGYGSVVYVRVPRKDGKFDVSFITSRSRVAPVKKLSLPRLELLGALLCARLVCHVKKALELPQETQCYCWTDSMVTLGWVKGEPTRWKTFVANRVIEIQKLTHPSQWFHCPGVDNPADLLTRGIFADQLVSCSEWLHGPEWLSESISTIVSTKEVSPADVEKFLRPELFVTMTVTSVWMPLEQVLPVERWGRFDRAIRITGFALRFISGVKDPQHLSTGELSLEELATAKDMLLRHTQQVRFGVELEALKQGKPVAKSSSLYNLSPMIGRDGLIRIGGRLENADLSYSEKHPIILPKCHLAVLLIRSEHIRLKHAPVEVLLTNLRDTYWIISARRLAKSIKKDCFQCQLKDATACNQVAAPLPAIRVHEAPVFTVTGLDYGGPLFCLDFPNHKFYILLFTCAVVRAVHLELTESLDVPDCILALRRFIARRGLPSLIYSDNAQTFKGTEKLMVKVYGTVFPKWKNICSRAPWWGGWWERLVKSVKSALRKTVGNKSLTKVELETTLCEIEACINCRPLTFVGDEVDCHKPLTPAHFLLGRNAGFQTVVDEQEYEVSTEHLSEAELIRQRRLELFWTTWSRDYLRNLPPAINKFQNKGEIGVGSVVLIREDNLVRMRWPLAVVTKLFPGKDGHVRSVELRTARGTLVRPVQRLHDLEVPGARIGGSFGDDSSSRVVQNGSRVNVSPVVQKTGGPTVTRAGRVVKPKVKPSM